MADDTDTTTGASTTPDASQTVEMETITLNNRQITVPKSAVNVLKETESNLMRGYQDVLSKEREKINENLAKDTEWYRTHDASLWDNYDPLIGGGKGFTGDENLLKSVQKNEPVVSPATNGKSFGDEMRLKQLERELEETKKTVEMLKTSDVKRGEAQVCQDRDSLLIKYPYADIDSVNDALKLFYVNNQRHPLRHEVEIIVKKKNDPIAVKVENAKLAVMPKKTAAPSVSGTSPLSKKEKLPHIEDVDGWVKLAHEDLVEK